MKIRTGVLLAVGVLAVPLVFVGWPAAYFLLVYGCGLEEDALERALQAESVLDAPPDGAESVGKPYSGCDDDDLFVSVERAYRYEGSPAALQAYYRKAAPARGWQPVARSEGKCFTKRVDGATAYLSFWYPEEYEQKTDADFAVGITAQRGSTEEWC
ncbi:hypothetical protein GCM10020367_31610 [Streptomyces sannanensis]|uniref:Uncharacterized protein n=1 Tax=Streptomyces sannanensis TaxID=285536 RepID=A0ABP6SCB0_9ACTN